MLEITFRVLNTTVDSKDVEVQVQLKAYGRMVDDRLSELLPSETARPTELAGAIRYACLAPGKRLRPALCLACANAAGGEVENALNVACAIEMLHCFSLIHDDLPALDNDNLRRGRPTCHVAFGEAIAILAGDALLALSFETIVAPKLGIVPSAEMRLECVRILSQACGTDGLVSGEAADLLAEGRELDRDQLHYIHTHKTGALISAACEMGAVLANADHESTIKLARYGVAVGLAFQIADDLLNETSSAEQLGKSAGSDRARRKATYPALVGLEESKKEALALAAEAQAHLKGLPGPTEFLTDVAVFSVERVR